MQLTHIGTNQAEITFGDITVLFSYSTPVAYRNKDGAEFYTQTKYSNTTSRHINEWLKNRGSAYPVHQSTIDAKVSL